ncbi:hypothetical protein [Nocardioides nanhaiensis]|uniref:DUF4878 domain-containing protein n=1 Tax=Nocardioides nanhaiensis TaxID=1476871 RepID=A0ABP8VPV3_9ACTN
MTSTEPTWYRLTTRVSDAGSLRAALVVLVVVVVVGAAGVTAAAQAAAGSPRGIVARYERALGQIPADCDVLGDVATRAHADELAPLCLPTGDEADWVFGWPEGGEATTRTQVVSETEDGDTARVELFTVSTSPGSRVEARTTYVLERENGDWRVAGTG